MADMLVTGNRSPEVIPSTMLVSEAQVWVIRLCPDEHVLEYAYSVLSDEERHRAERVRFEKLQTMFILSHGVLRMLLARYCNCSPSDLAYAYGAHGKPFLAEPACFLRFNMSHSGDIAAYAFHRHHEIGVDVEQHRPLMNIEAIAARFFSPAEHLELMTLGPAERDFTFFRYWVRKEAYIKARGGSLSIPLEGFQLPNAPARAAAIVSMRDKPVEPSQWRVSEFFPAQGYSGAVALRDVRSKVRVHAIRAAAEVFVRSSLIAARDFK
jgi:4'-phosphopantetheinyl transferase